MRSLSLLTAVPSGHASSPALVALLVLLAGDVRADSPSGGLPGKQSLACHPDGNWSECRRQLVAEMLGTAGDLPNRSDPDWVIPLPEYQMHGWPAAGPGCRATAPCTDTRSGCGWGNNLTQLVWRLDPLPGGIVLNATVFWSLNTSGAAPGNYPPLPDYPGMPSAPIYPRARGDTLLLYHNGHETGSCVPNFDGVVDYYNQAGYDVMELMMPMLGCNARPDLQPSPSHQWFEQFERQGVHTMKYFVEPVVLAVNYAVNRLGYKHDAGAKRRWLDNHAGRSHRSSDSSQFPDSRLDPFRDEGGTVRQI